MQFRSTGGFSPLSIEEAFKELESSPQGLSEEEAKARLSLWGYNEVPEKRTSPVVFFLTRFWGPMPWLLEIAILFSFLLGRSLEGALISFLLFLNAIIGFWHRWNSTKTVELLKKKLQVSARILRNGEIKIRQARELVPGDVVHLKQGDLVPADLKVFQGEASVDQSAITGESLPVSVKEGGILYSGSILKRGELKALVLNTGTRSFYGTSLELVRIAQPKSHQEELILKVIRYSLLFAMFCALGASVFGIFVGLNITTILEFDLTMLMGAVPVAIPVMLTIVQAAGAIELSRKGVLVTRLDSVEDAASCDILCLDKTGTITENRITVEGVAPLEGTEEEVLLWAGLASEKDSPDQIDWAILNEIEKRKIDLSTYRRLSFNPFDPETRRTEALVTNGNGETRVFKGAPQVIANLFTFEEADKANLEEIVKEFSKKGARSIAVALEKEGQARILGVIGLYDPPRKEAFSTIEKLKKLNVKPIMITGDNILIAQQIAKLVGIGSRVRSLAELKELPDRELSSLLEQLDGIAEVFPEDKYQIVKHLQEKGHIVGMTGDGVNDAPALKQAELGIAVENATDAARASASVVLTKPGIEVILDCLILSRKTFQRTLTWILNKIIKVVEFSALLTLGFIWLRTSVLPLLHMALLILANDFATMSLATDRVEFSSSPNIWNVKNIALAALIPGLLFFLEDTLILIWGHSIFHLPQLQSLILLALVFNSQMRIMLVRERRHFWSSLPGRALTLAALFTVVTFSALTVWGIVLYPISLRVVFGLFLFILACALVIDFPKFYLFRKLLRV